MVGKAMLWAVGNVRISVAELVRGWPIVVLCQSVATSAINPFRMEEKAGSGGEIRAMVRNKIRSGCPTRNQGSGASLIFHCVSTLENTHSCSSSTSPAAFIMRTMVVAEFLDISGGSIS